MERKKQRTATAPGEGVNEIKQGATTNTKEVSPYYPYPVDELDESAMLEYLKRAEEAAAEAEAQADRAETEADRSEAEANRAAAEADRAAAEADRAEAEADRAEALFAGYPQGSGAILNDQQSPTDVVSLTGDPCEFDGNIALTQNMSFQVIRMVAGDYRINTYSGVAIFYEDVWGFQLISHSYTGGQDTDVYFSMTTDPTTKIGKFQYTSSDMQGQDYAGSVDFKGSKFI